MSGSHKTSPLMALPETDSIYVTMRVGAQLFGIDVKHVRDVLQNQHITRIPLAPQQVAGSLNSRGRIVTVIDARRRLGMEALEPSKSANTFVVVDLKGELYSLLVDSVGDVMTLPNAHIEDTPANLASNWRALSSGIFKLDDELLVLIDIHAFLKMS
jgi:purine-binding chemotaxis protein CheW